MDGLARTRCRTACATTVAALAVRPEDQAQGLQGRHLEPGRVLAFPYAAPTRVAFHMGAVAYPIDLAFVGPDGRVAKLVEGARPGAKARWGADHVTCVLETHAGDARRLGFVVGADVRLGPEAEGEAASATVVDPGAFSVALLEGLARSRRAPAWRPDVPTRGHTETAVVDAAMVEAWLRAIGVDDASLAGVVAAVTSAEGWSVLGDALILAGLADTVRLDNGRLVLNRGRKTVRDGREARALAERVTHATREERRMRPPGVYCGACGGDVNTNPNFPDVGRCTLCGSDMDHETTVELDEDEEVLRRTSPRIGAKTRAIAQVFAPPTSFPPERATLSSRVHPGVSAVMAVRAAIAGLSIPNPDIRYAGMHRLSGAGAHQITDGVIDVHLQFRTARGVNHTVQVPVHVQNGRLVKPAVLIDQGTYKLFAQHTFDEMIGRAEFSQERPARQMFQPSGGGRTPLLWD